MDEATKAVESTEETEGQVEQEKESQSEALAIESETIEEAESPPEPKKKTAQDRINEITWKHREAEREAEFWRNKALSSEETKPSAPEVKSDRPMIEQFETVTEYEDALFEWRDKKKGAEILAANEKKKQQEAFTSFNKNAAKIKTEHPDFDEVIKRPVFTPYMSKVLFDIDNGPMVAYHIATNSEVADKIKALSPERQMYEIGRLETQLLLAQKTKKVTTAPEPFTPVGSSGSAIIDESKLTDDQWYALDKKRREEKLIKQSGG